MQENINTPKGKAYLYWAGKTPPKTASMFPCELTTSINNDNPLKQPYYKDLEQDWSNLLFHGDNKEVLQTLITNGFRGKVDLIYIDPPFDSGADYVKKVKLRSQNIQGEEQSLAEQVQYNDIWKQDSYLQFMYERLILLRELLSDQGSIYLHCDHHKSHHLRCLLDEVFGEDNFVNEIIWCYTSPSKGTNFFPRKHDTIFWYSKTGNYISNIENIRIPYKSLNQGGGTFGEGLDENNSEEYLLKGKIVEDYWKDINFNENDWIDEISPVARLVNELTNYPTQKPQALLERIIKASSNPESIVLDCFIGSGTTPVVAQKLGRKWIGVDCNKGAVQTTIKRLQKQAKEGKNLFEERSLKILHYKVNNYDFGELFLMREAIFTKYGLSSTSNSYFSAKQQEKYVKIIDLNRPINPLDIELSIKEIDKLADYEENVLIIHSGIQDENIIKDIIAKRNRMSIKKIELINIQKDGIIEKKPSELDITIKRDKNKVKIEINNYLSHQILSKLNNEEGIFVKDIEDFRVQIDYLIIDLDYRHGEVFKQDFADIPQKKNNMIKGNYELESTGKIAIKIVDVIGEEMLYVEE